VALLVDDGELLDARPEEHPGGVLDRHVRGRHQQVLAHRRRDGIVILGPEQVACADVADHAAALDDRKAPVVALEHPASDRRDGVLRVD
jgi:hypothetical protein